MFPVLPRAGIEVVGGLDIACTSNVEALLADTQPRDRCKAAVDRGRHDEISAVRFHILPEQLHRPNSNVPHAAPRIGAAVFIADLDGAAPSGGAGHRLKVDTQVDMVGLQHAACVLLEDGDAHEIGRIKMS